MKKEYDFSQGKRGPVIIPPANKTRITIRLDNDILSWFKTKVNDSGGGSYQTMINEALKQYISTEKEPIETTLRKIIREELSRPIKTD